MTYGARQGKRWQEQLSDTIKGGKQGVYHQESWQERHYKTRAEHSHPIAILLGMATEAIGSIGITRWPDENITSGFGKILDGILQLLNEDLGGMDGGTLWQEVAVLAETIRWDLDTSEVIWDTEEE